MPFSKFITYLQHEKRCSPHTVTGYSTDLRDFSEYCQTAYEINDPADANHTVIRSWVVRLMEREISPRSIRRKLSSLNAFYRFCMRNGVIIANPVRKVTSPKVPKRLPVFIEESRMDGLFNDAEFPEGFAGVRDLMMLEMFYATGMRLSELISLKLRDVSSKQLKVLGKRNKERIIPITDHLAENIQNYLNLRSEMNPKETECFFIGDSGKKLYPKFVYRKINFYLSQATTAKKKSPHVLRHTFATHMLNKGADLNAIKELLGHASLAATQVYTHNTIEKLRSIYQQAHPLAG